MKLLVSGVFSDPKIIRLSNIPNSLQDVLDNLTQATQMDKGNRQFCLKHESDKPLHGLSTGEQLTISYGFVPEVILKNEDDFQEFKLKAQEGETCSTLLVAACGHDIIANEAQYSVTPSNEVVEQLEKDEDNDSTIGTLTEKLQESERKNESLLLQVRTLNESCRKRNSKIAALQQEILEISELNGTIQELNYTIQELNYTIPDLDATIEYLKEKNESLLLQVRTLNESCRKRNSKIAALQQAVRRA